MTIDRGTYALVFSLPGAVRVRIGALGTFLFPKGYYVYVGSALNGLEGRLARHRRTEKRFFWHIDYLLPHARIVDTWTDSSGRRLECRWARALLAERGAAVIVRRFGASDCACAAHLVHFDHFPLREGIRL